MYILIGLAVGFAMCLVMTKHGNKRYWQGYDDAIADTAKPVRVKAEPKEPTKRGRPPRRKRA